LSDYPDLVINWAVPSDLDRVDHHRGSAEWVAGLWHAEDAKLLTLDPESRFSTNAGGSKLRMTRPFMEFDSQRHRLLGLLNGSPIFAVEELADGEMHDFREVGFQLTDNERDIAATAAALTHWHRMEPQCPRCGAATVVINGGFARHCTRCGQDNFPRTDPAVIVAVVDADDRLLLGGQAAWGNRVSVLAGFVESGESLEHAIHREIGEEVDISLSELRYFGSQPWPFPRSLMVAFFGRATDTDIRVDTDEIAHAEWYTRDQLSAKLDSGALELPGNSSIASRMIHAWRAAEAPL
jgi:NAD+ diphosphatase